MRIPDETAELTNLQAMLRYTGLWLKTEDMTFLDKFLAVAYFVFFTLYIVLIDLSLMQIEPALLSYKPYAPFTVWLNVHYLTIIYFLLKHKDFIVFRDRMSALMRKCTSDWEQRRFQELNRMMWKFAAIYCMFAVFMGLILTMVPPVVDVILLLVTGSEVPFYMPFPMESFVKDDKRRNFAMYFFQLLNGVNYIAPGMYYVSYIGLLPATVTYFFFQLDVMDRRLANWEQMDKGNPQRRNLFREIVEDHNEIMRLTDLMKELLAPCYVGQNLITSINVGFYLHFAKLAMSRGEPALAAIQAYYACIASSGIIVSNFFGQILYDKGDEVSQRIYNLKWLDQPIKDQKDLQLVLVMSQKPVVIAFKNTFPLNLQTLTDLMKQSYTLFVLLESVLTEL